MAIKEYFKLPIKIIPPDIIQHYKLTSLQHKEHIYIQINKGMYGLPQAGILAHNKLVKILTPFGYYKDKYTPGLWKHKNNNIFFTLVVDDFGISFTNNQEVIHFINILQTHYNITTDWTGNRYCGFHLNWNYIARTVIISMPSYVNNAIQKFQHIKCHKQQHSPAHWTPPTYGTKIQYSSPMDTSPTINKRNIRNIQKIIVTFLYFALSIDNTMLVTLGDLASQQMTPTEQTMITLIHY